MFGKPDVPDNCFTMSMIPWVSFEGFNLNLQKGYDYLYSTFFQNFANYVMDR